MDLLLGDGGGKVGGAEACRPHGWLTVKVAATAESTSRPDDVSVEVFTFLLRGH